MMKKKMAHQLTVKKKTKKQGKKRKRRRSQREVISIAPT